jgi:hypothetical protein
VGNYHADAAEYGSDVRKSGDRIFTRTADGWSAQYVEIRRARAALTEIRMPGFERRIIEYTNVTTVRQNNPARHEKVMLRT